MRHDTAQKYQDSIVEQIKTHYRHIIRYNLPFETHLQNMSAIRSTDVYKKLPHYRKEYIRAIDELLFHQLYEPIYIGAEKIKPALIEWVLIHPTTGKRYRENDNSWLHELTSEEKSLMHGCHVWRYALDQNQWKPFTAQEKAGN